VGDAEVRTGGVARTVLGCLLILASAPVFLWLVPNFKGFGVVTAGLIALSVIVVGIFLAGRWLGVIRRRQGSLEQQGCLPLLVTLLALVSAAVILYYVVYYGAGAYLGGWNV